MNQDLVKLDRLDGNNYARWKDNMMFLLTALRILYILDSELSPPLEEPRTSAEGVPPDAEEIEHDYWKKLLHKSEDFTLEQFQKHLRIEESRKHENKVTVPVESNVHYVDGSGSQSKNPALQLNKVVHYSLIKIFSTQVGVPTGRTDLKCTAINVMQCSQATRGRSRAVSAPVGGGHGGSNSSSERSVQVESSIASIDASLRTRGATQGIIRKLPLGSKKRIHAEVTVTDATEDGNDETFDELGGLLPYGRHHENKPLFSLSPLKNGLYSVEYNASISLLQAFSVCVASIISQTLSNVLKVNNLSEAKCIPERTAGVDVIKTPNTFPKEVPAKFAPSSTHSPFGRV
ncbi:hypothetical protein RJ639_006680 [Escallonia herrerae]|uniref:Uncharacterized protein n=1 Tax=Escallonia herrerae TaxID=1293975 RepID=A0AA88VXF7_9ASTE|nr:hypothetical protein RJ639_006680 [Escallonia herrerae]